MLKILLIGIVLIASVVVLFLLRKRHVFKLHIKQTSNFLQDATSTVDSVRYGNLAVRVEDGITDDTKNLSDSINRMIESFNDREEMIVEYHSELTSKNSFLTALINSLSDGLLVLNENYVILNDSKKIRLWFKDAKITGRNLIEFISIPSGKKISDLSDDEIFIKCNPDLCFKASTTSIESKEHHDKYMVVVTNYTNQKEVETLKEDFVATLTHDLKVPIIAESNMLEFFLNGKFGKLDKKQKDVLKNMQSSNKELLDLVQIVLDTYKVKDGEIDLKIEPVSVKDFLEDVIGDMSVIAEKTNNKIILHLRSDFNIDIDYIQFKRVLKNLLNNAILYGKPNTNIEISVKREWDNVTISVKDYGKGIAKEDIDNIFNRYYSVGKNARKIGTGLGLYLSQKIVKAHGGIIKVLSREGKYTQFSIHLPV